MPTDEYCEDCGGEFSNSSPDACVCADEDCCVDGDCYDCLLDADLADKN